MHIFALRDALKFESLNDHSYLLTVTFEDRSPAEYYRKINKTWYYKTTTNNHENNETINFH